jgi:hypothetical protein
MGAVLLISFNAVLKQIKGLGTLIALTFLLTLDDPHRFRRSRRGRTTGR